MHVQSEVSSVIRTGHSAIGVADLQFSDISILVQTPRVFLRGIVRIRASFLIRLARSELPDYSVDIGICLKLVISRANVSSGHLSNSEKM